MIKMKGRTGLWTAARLVFSLGLVAVVASRVDLAEMGRTLATANPGWLLLAWLLAQGSWLAASVKWQQLLAALGSRVALGELFALNMVGMFYTLFLPGQLGGEVVKGIKLARRGVPGTRTTISIGVDRLTGVMALSVLALGGLAFAPAVEGGPVLALAAFGMLALSVSPLAALWLVRHLPFTVEQAAARLPAARLFSPIMGVLIALGQAFVEYRRSPRTLAAALALALVYQSIIVLSNVCAALALGVELPLAAMTWVVAMTSILHLIPLSLAGLGVREGAYVVLLTRYGVSNELALALALAVFGIILVQGLTGGLIDLFSGIGRSVRVDGDAAGVTVSPAPSLQER